VPSEWELVSSYLQHAAQYCISSLTLAELLVGLANGASPYFDQHQRRLRLLLGPSPEPEVFDFIPYFVAPRLGLNIERPSGLEGDFLGTINLILSAGSKDELTKRFPIEKIAKELAETKTRYTEFMTGRNNYLNGRQISPDVWASHILRFYGMSGDSVALAEVVKRLSANYEFEVYVSNLVRNDNFAISEHTTDLIDVQQLCYLCDPTVVFITNDSDFKNRTRKSAQANRIKTFNELLACARCKSPLL